jgi:predicted MPP superfamily phosphohydrolase
MLKFVIQNKTISLTKTSNPFILVLTSDILEVRLTNLIDKVLIKILQNQNNKLKHIAPFFFGV